MQHIHKRVTIIVPNKISLKSRIHQIEDIGNFIKQMTKGLPLDWPILVAGDFNMDTLQTNCPKYEICHQVLNKSKRQSNETFQNKNAFMDAVKYFHKGKIFPTTTPFEWIEGFLLYLR